MAGVRNVTASVKQLRGEGRLQLRDVAELRARPRDPEITWLLHDSGLVGVAEAWYSAAIETSPAQPGPHLMMARMLARNVS